MLSTSSPNKIFLSIDINISPSNPSWSIVDRNLVFTRFSVEKERSAEHDVIGIATAIA